MEVFSGSLTVKISGFLKTKTLSDHWCILYGGKGNFPPRLDVFESKINLDQAVCKKSVDIINARWGQADTFEPGFCFYIKSKRYVFVSRTEENCKLWIQHLCCLSLDLFNSSQSSESNVMAEEEMHIQDNVLYASSNDITIFDVVADGKLGSGCQRLGLHGMFKLCFDTKCIKLYRINSGSSVAEWPYVYIRSYGHSEHAMNITAGSRSPTGEGLFSFLTVEGARMVELIVFHTKRLKEEERSKSIDEAGTKSNMLTSDKKKIHASSSNPPSYNSSLRMKGTPPSPLPKPIPSPGIISSNAFDAQFKKELHSTISTTSISSRSSNESLSKKEQKKVQLELKKKAKQEQKESKEREKMEKRLAKEKQKQEEKLKKAGVKKKPPVPVPKKDFPSTQEPVETVYSIPEGEEYAECDFETRNITRAREDVVESKLYNEPWEPLPVQLTQDALDENSDGEDVYASPVKAAPGKITNGNRNIDSISQDSYEDLEEAAPAVPPKLDDDSSNNNVYDHFAGNSPKSPEVIENVYGIESAKSI